MTIIEKVYNFYNGLLGKTNSEILDDPRIDKFVEDGIKKEYVPTAKGISFLIPSAAILKQPDAINMKIWDEKSQKYVRETKVKYLYYRLKELKQQITMLREYSKKVEKFTKKPVHLKYLMSIIACREY